MPVDISLCNRTYGGAQMSTENDIVKIRKFLNMDPLVKLLIINALAGNYEFIFTAKRYFVDNESPSTIAMETKLPTKRIRIWIQRIKEKTENNDRKARRIIETLYSALMKIEPIAAGEFCKVCGQLFGKKIVWHIRNSHHDLVFAAYKKIVEEVSRGKR